MIKLIKQTSEFYCSTKKEGEELILRREEETLGTFLRQSIEAKNEWFRVIIVEEYDNPIELAKNDTHDSNEYYELVLDE